MSKPRIKPITICALAALSVHLSSCAQDPKAKPCYRKLDAQKGNIRIGSMTFPRSGPNHTSTPSTDCDGSWNFQFNELYVLKEGHDLRQVNRNDPYFYFTIEDGQVRIAQGLERFKGYSFFKNYLGLDSSYLCNTETFPDRDPWTACSVGFTIAPNTVIRYGLAVNSLNKEDVLLVINTISKDVISISSSKIITKKRSGS